MSKGTIQGMAFRLLHLISPLKIFCDYKEVEETNCPQTDQMMSRQRIRIWDDVLLGCKTDILFYPHCLLTTLQSTGLKFASSALFSFPWPWLRNRMWNTGPFSLATQKLGMQFQGAGCAPLAVGGQDWPTLENLQQPKWGESHPDPAFLQRVCVPHYCPQGPACCFGGRKWLKPCLWTKCRQKPNWAQETAHLRDWLFNFVKVVLGQNLWRLEKTNSHLSFYHLLV